VPLDRREGRAQAGGRRAASGRIGGFPAAIASA
jgi:hypothetical protein